MRVGIVLAGSFCYASAFPPLEWQMAAWLAPLLWLAALEGLEARGRFYCVFAGGFVAAAAVVFWFWPLFSLGSVILWGIIAFYFGLWGILVRALPLPPLAVPLWAAASWSGVEYLRGEVAPLSFSWMALGYSQVNLPGSVLASVAGVYAVSGAMVLWGAAVVELGKRVQRRNLRAGAPVLLALAALGLLPLTAQLDLPPWDGQSVATAELQQLSANDEVADLPETPAGEGAGADLVVWPEYCLFDDPFERHSSWFLDRMRREASRGKWGAIFGAIDLPEGGTREDLFWNTAFFLNPSGGLAGKAVKNQPIQLLSDGEPAREVAVLEIPGAGEPLRAGVGICYDGSFQRFVLRMAQKRADLLVFPTYNASDWGSAQHLQHQRMFQMRAAETGRPVLVAAVSGPTFAAFPGGSASPVLPFGQTGRITVPIAAAGLPTLFVRGGWIVGPAAALLAAAGAFAAAVFRWRSRPKGASVP